MTLRSWPPAILACALALSLASAACSGGGNNDETPTVATVDAVSEQTQVAVNTEEAGAVATATRAPGPAEQPTAASGTVRLATTNGLVESGLLTVLVPLFEEETGYALQVVAFPTASEAIAQGAAGNADALLVNAPDDELAMTTEGSGIERAPVMRGDFVIVGPDTDPALVRDQERADDALRAISATQNSFVTTIEGTAARAHELRVWSTLGLLRQGKWYQSSGQGVAGTLALASERQAYTISDRAAYLAARDLLDLEILLAGDPAQVDPYHVIVINPAVQPAANATGARALAAFLVRPDVQQIIAEYGVAEYGEPLFAPNAATSVPAP